MTDPIAEAAAQQQNDPSLLEKAMDTIHSLEAKVEHLMHPEATSVTIESKPSLESAPIATAEVAAGQLGESSPGSWQEASVSIPSPITGDAPNATTESPTFTSTSITGIEAPPSGAGEIQVMTSATSSAIRASIANIKQHLSVRGFELSAVADIHAELAAIERFL